MARVVIDPAAEKKLKTAVVAGGLLELAMAIKDRAQARAGSFSRTGRFQRGIYAAAYVDGRWAGGDRVDGNGEQVPDHSVKDGVVVGVNVPYGRFVHRGTSDTKAHPVLTEALEQTAPSAGSLVAAGTRRRLT